MGEAADPPGGAPAPAVQALVDDLCSRAAGGDHRGVTRLVTGGLPQGHASQVVNGLHQGMTPLLWAARQGHHQCVKALLACPAVDPNLMVNLNGAPLWALLGSAVWGQQGCVEELLRCPRVNPNLNQPSACPQNALCTSAVFGNLGVVEALLRCPRLDVNLLSTEDGASALYMAACEGHLRVVEALLGAPGVDVNARTKLGATPVHIAAYRGYTSCLVALLRSPDVLVSVHANNGSTPLHAAAEKGHLACVDALLAHPGTDLSARDGSGRSAEMVAAVTRRKECVASLRRAATLRGSQGDPGGGSSGSKLPAGDEAGPSRAKPHVEYPGPPEDWTHRCAVCQAPHAKLCSSCKALAYCGRACQKSDWKEHKKLCRPTPKKRPANPPPTASSTSPFHDLPLEPVELAVQYHVASELPADDEPRRAAARIAAWERLYEDAKRRREEIWMALAASQLAIALGTQDGSRSIELHLEAAVIYRKTGDRYREGNSYADASCHMEGGRKQSYQQRGLAMMVEEVSIHCNNNTAMSGARMRVLPMREFP